MIKGIFYSIKQAFKQLFRNKGMSLASIFSITSMMMILAIFLFLSVNINFLTENIKDQFGTIDVYLKDETTQDQTALMITDIRNMSGVEDVIFIPKEQALEEFKIRFGENAYLLDDLDENPLPNTIRITLSDIEFGDMIAGFLSSVDGVDRVRFYREEISKVIQISDAIQKGALVVIAFLIVVSIIVVANTIKLTVMARQDEISIMRYIGATNWFIRGPMFFEGILIGSISAALSVGLSSLLYIKLCDALGNRFFMLFYTQLVEPRFLIINIIWIFLALGISIGTCGSMISMRRYLKA